MSAYGMGHEKKKFPIKGISLGTIITVSGTGAEMNAGAVITYEEKNWKGPIFGIAPEFAILNLFYTMSVPSNQVISGAFDMLSNAMETYLGHSDQDNASDDVALAIMRNTVINLK